MRIPMRKVAIKAAPTAQSGTDGAEDVACHMPVIA
jgi:hypothetical protein